MEDIKRTGCDETEYIQVPGPMGPQGPRGEQGIQGPQGPQGLQGPKGDQGERGCTGPKGDRGPQGDIGPQGERGLPGLNGRDGARGPEGPRGCTGASGKVAFEKLTEEQREMLRGPQGPQGERGPQGMRGYPGAQGMQGPTGVTGPQGARGPEGPAGPRGPEGPMGPQGLMGPTGAPGKDGGVVTKPHIATDEAWSSKDTVDYALHGKTNWVKKSIMWGDDISTDHKIPDTVNGYAKNSKVYGRTMTNYVTLPRRHREEATKKPVDEAQKQVVSIFDKAQNGGVGMISDTYTLIYNMESIIVMKGGQPEVGTFAAKIVLTKRDGSTIVEYAPLTTGYIKKKIVISGQDQIDKIELFPFNIQLAPESFAGAVVTFVAKEFMLLRADYDHKIPPEYFHGTRGVGSEIPKQPGKYAINIVSKNKNLLNEDPVKGNLLFDYYMGKDSGELQGRARWRQAAEPGSVATFLVYCKPNTDYVFSGHILDENKARLVISQFVDDPYNGEPSLIDNTYSVGGLHPGDEVHQFRTSPQTNMLAIYVGNFEATPEKDRHINNIFDKLQLEEGTTTATSYEPYRSMTKTLTIDKQLYNEEYLYWDRNKNKYFIHEKNSDRPGGFDERELTEINDEQLIHTYEGVTYVYIQSKIPSKIDAEYPVNAHNYYYTKEQEDANINAAKEEIDRKLDEEYYKKNQWALHDNELEEGLNFAKFPNGLVMQWKRVMLNGPNQHVTVEFKALGEIYTVMATPYNAQQGSSDKFEIMTRVNTDESSHGEPWPKIDVWSTFDRTSYAQVLAIGRSGGQ